MLAYMLDGCALVGEDLGRNMFRFHLFAFTFILASFIVSAALALSGRSEVFPLFHWALFTRAGAQGSFVGLQCQHASSEKVLTTAGVVSQYNAGEAAIISHLLEMSGPNVTLPDFPKELKILLDSRGHQNCVSLRQSFDFSENSIHDGVPFRRFQL